MKERLPIDMENLTLPVDEFTARMKKQEATSYGYVSILYIISLMITIGTIITIIAIGG